MGKHSNNDSPFGRRARKAPVRRRITGDVTPTGRLSGHRMPSSGGAGGGSGSRRRGPLEAAPARLRAERGRRQGRAKRIAAIAAASLLAVVLIVGVGVFAYAKHLESTMGRTVDQQEKLDLDLKKAEAREPFNMLLLGFDKRANDTAYRSDTIILARVDPTTKQVWLLSIPRDTKVQIPGHGSRKANEAFALGEEKLAIQTIEKFAGVPIHNYMGVNFKGFNKAVDAMGGVWIDVPVAINDPKADATRDKRASRIDPGYQLLDGEHALTFVRTRYTFADSDFGRMRNQQAFFLALADQLADKTPVSRLPKIVAAMAPYISTDMSLMDMMRMAQVLQGAGGKRIHTETITGTWRSPYVVTDEEVKAELLAKFKAGEPFKEPEPSEEVTGTATPTSSSRPSSTSQTQEKSPGSIEVSVRNGAGIAGCAKQASSVLKARAFKVLDVGNAGQFVYDKTLIVYTSDRAAAEQVAKALPPGAKLVESRGMYSYKGDVLVVVGKDWDIARVPVAPINTN